MDGRLGAVEPVGGAQEAQRWNYLWDTHAWIWAANNDPQLSHITRRQLWLHDRAGSRAIARYFAVGNCDVSAWADTFNGSLERWFEQAIAVTVLLPIPARASRSLTRSSRPQVASRPADDPDPATALGTG
jgi:hypothetical protein